MNEADRSTTMQRRKGRLEKEDEEEEEEEEEEEAVWALNKSPRMQQHPYNSATWRRLAGRVSTTSKPALEPNAAKPANGLITCTD